jgi:hypothetical protein
MTSLIGCGMRGWQVPAYPFTGELESTAFQRILVKRDFTRDMADLLSGRHQASY